MAQSKPSRVDRTHAVSASFNRGAWRWLWRPIHDVVNSEVGPKFRLMFAGIVVLLLGISGLNVVSSYVGRDLMTAIERHSVSGFLSTALLYVFVFAALTVAAVLARFIEEHLALLWREWLTRDLVAQYLSGGAYLDLRERGELGNPDQRIADDARAFTATTLSFLLMFLNALFAFVTFSGVMWSISPMLFGVAVAYAALGSFAATVTLVERSDRARHRARRRPGSRRRTPSTPDVGSVYVRSRPPDLVAVCWRGSGSAHLREPAERQRRIVGL